MPFTFAHPAIVLPLVEKYGKWFSTSALIIGSIIPDFESFIWLSEHKFYSHTWPGIFWFDLPLALIFTLIFHNIVRDPLIKSLPESLNRRFVRFIGFNWNAYFREHYLKILLSLIIGITSHLLWDAFTHLNLARPNAIDSWIYIGRFRLFKVLQYSNSVLGLIVVAWYVMRMPEAMPEEKVAGKNMIFTIEPVKPGGGGKVRYWLLVMIIAAATIGVSVLKIKYEIDIILVIDICISGMLLALILAPIMLRYLFADEHI